MIMNRRVWLILAVFSLTTARAQSSASDIPDAFVPQTANHDYTRRELEIRMRDGVKLHSVMIIPKGVSQSPILLDRTPYGADKATDFAASAHADRKVAPAYGLFLRAGYIVVFQDVRGKYGSKGAYVNERPLRGPDNPTAVDHATDAWDTIDWLVKNVKESNGRVGMIGTSYDGMMVVMALTQPHPALQAAVAANPVINTWMGDDDFHGGALRMINFDYYFQQDSVRGDGGDLWRAKHDDYDTFSKQAPQGISRALWGLDQLPPYDACMIMRPMTPIGRRRRWRLFWHDVPAQCLLYGLPASGTRRTSTADRGISSRAFA